ncbi:AAA family ATPase [Bacteroides rodentium]|uniref:AAA family ATPase n=1 Tax=Bacteroides rodentium TaxID=691816 RepID=UPI00046F6A03|nr:AAA family ATPase [Bacteroides rodentium]
MDSNIEIYIESLGPVRNSRIELKPFMVFSGESGTGKSYTALLVHYIYRVLCGNEISDFFTERDASYDKQKEQLPDAEQGFLHEFTLQEFEAWCSRSAIKYVGEMVGNYSLEGKVSIKFNGLPTDRYKFSYAKEVLEMEGEMKYYDTVSMNGTPLRLPHASTGWGAIPYAVLFTAFIKVIFRINQNSTFLLPPSRGGIVSLSDIGRNVLTGMYKEFMWDLSDLKAISPKSETNNEEYSTLSRTLIDGTINLHNNDLYYEQASYGEIPILAGAASIKELAPFALMLQKGLVSNYSIMFEEPETNLHPELQLKVADILAQLLQQGCRFQVTTHSDYFLRRINDLLRLHLLKNRLSKDEYEAFCQEHHYDPEVTIPARLVNAYYFKRNADKTVSITAQDAQSGIPFDTFRSVLENQLRDSSYVYDKICELNEAAYNKAYPNYASSGVVAGYTFDETSNSSKPDTFKQLTINGMNGIIIPSVIVKDDTSIFSNAGSNAILKEDCDGIFLTEQDKQKTIYLCELKSSFSTQQICKAKDQIIASYLKLHSLLSLLQSYTPDEWVIKGIIASFKPNEDVQSYLSKQKEVGDKAGSFCYNLYRDKKYRMPEANCKRFYAPLSAGNDLALRGGAG